MWDTVKRTNIMRYEDKKGTIADGFSKEQVRKRFPKLFELGQHDGFWKDDRRDAETEEVSPRLAGSLSDQ